MAISFTLQTEPSMTAKNKNEYAIPDGYDIRSILPIKDEIDYHTWGTDECALKYKICNALYQTGQRIIKNNSHIYTIEYVRGRSGMGGMDDGSPDFYTVKRAKIFEVNKPKETT